MRRTEKLQTHGAGVRWHAVQYPTSAGDQTVAAFFLHTGQAAQKFVGDVFAQTGFAKTAARYVETLGTQRRDAVGFKVTQLETGHVGIVDLAEVVVDSHHLQPQRIRRDHAPAGQVVQCGAPQNCFFTACIHSDIAAYARGFSRCRVDRKHQTGGFGGVSHSLSDHTGFCPQRGRGLRQARQHHGFHGVHGGEFFGVDDHALPGQGNRAAGVAGAAAARHDGQTEFDTGFDQTRHFGFAIRGEHHKRVFDPPVGGIGHMRHPAHGIELDIVLSGAFTQHFLRFFTQTLDLVKLCGKLRHRHLRGGQQTSDRGIALDIGCALLLASELHVIEPVAQGLDQQAAARRVVQQIVLQIRVALHHPNVAQHLKQHARRAAGASLKPQTLEHGPGLLAEQTDHDLAVGKRGVVVGDFPQTMAVSDSGHQFV